MLAFPGRLSEVAKFPGKVFCERSFRRSDTKTFAWISRHAKRGINLIFLLHFRHSELAHYRIHFRRREITEKSVRNIKFPRSGNEREISRRGNPVTIFPVHFVSTEIGLCAWCCFSHCFARKNSQKIFAGVEHYNWIYFVKRMVKIGRVVGERRCQICRHRP